MKRYLTSVVDIRRGEWGVTLLMLVNVIALLATYYFLKPARDSIFLSQQSAEQLPWVFIITALASAPIISLYGRAGRTLKLNQLINITTLIIIGCLVGFYFLIQYPWFWVPYVFYVWVSIYGALTVSQFWLLANAVFTSTQAKRLFPLLGLGAIIGGWAGGELTGLILPYFKASGLGFENLLFCCMALLAGSILVTNIVWRRQAVVAEEQSQRGRLAETRPLNMWETYKEISRSKHLLYLVGIVAMTMMVSSFVDFQFKAIASYEYPAKEDLGAFFGVFYGRLSLVSFFLQLLFSYSLIRRLGVGGVILFLPITMLLGSTVLLISAGIVGAVMVRGAQMSLQYSLDKTGRELLFLPVPLELKQKTKVFIDVMVDRGFRGLAGFLLLIGTVVFAFDPREPLGTVPYFSIAVIFFLVIWIILALIMRREYVNTFRTALRRRTIDPESVRIDIAQSATIKSLIRSLRSPNHREIAYALQLLKSTRLESLGADVIPLLAHRDDEIRQGALKVLQNCGTIDQLDRVKPLLEDRSIAVRREAFYFLYLFTDDRDELLNEYLGHARPSMMSVVIATLAEYGTPEEKKLITPSQIDTILAYDHNTSMYRVQVAEALGALAGREFVPHLRRLLEDASIEVQSATVDALGRMKDREFVPVLIRSLGRPVLRQKARQALEQYGTGILGTLYDYLTDRMVARTIRCHIPRVVSGLPVQEAVDLLTTALQAVEPGMKYYVLKALNRLRSRNVTLSFKRPAVDEVLIEETRSYYEILLALRFCTGHPGRPADRLLCRALTEQLDRNLERIFRLLGLTYPPVDIHSAYLGIVSTRKALRASAVEFLDNLLSNDQKKYLLPIIDDIPPETTLQRGTELFGLTFRTREDALLALINGRNPWLKSCAIYAAGQDHVPVIMTRIREMVGDDDPVVRQTAELVLGT
jgi:ATP/ADP translocase